MNRFLYKYMLLRPNFFDDPMIRATPTSALNDPFEGGFNNEQVQDANRNQREYYRENDQDVYEVDDSMLNDLAGTIQDDLHDLGIISFTEDYNNPLMWSHYADEHRGFVVEFDFKEAFFMDSINKVEGRASRFGKCDLGDVFEFPEKVNYRRDLPDFSRPELSAPDNMSEFHWKKFHRTILFTKSHDWIYEKEQRIIVRLRDADSVICNDNNDVRKECQKNTLIQLLELENGKIQVVFPPEYEMHEDMGDESIKGKIFLLTAYDNEPAVHLFRINPKAISSVYFGCRSNYHKALKEIQSNSLLTGLNRLFKMETNSHLYQLDKVNLK